jgi:hypothetical protein
MRYLITTLLLAVATATCAAAATAPAAADLSAQFARRMEQHPVLRAEFVQEKQMAAFKKPLVTRGRLVFVRGEGVAWKIEAPLKLIYILTDNRIVEIGEDGKANIRNAKDVPGIAQVGRVFRALLGAQTSAIADIFTTTPDGPPEAWRMTLTPKPGPLTQFMRQIQLAGGRYVERIVIEETNGDKTVIAFRNTSEHDSPSAEERAWFGVRQ